MPRLFARRRRSLVFMYGPKFQNSGSTVMRGRQLSGIAQQHLGTDFDITYAPIGTPVRDASVFLTKGALMQLTPELLDPLKRDRNRLLFDVVDEAPPPITDGYADVLLAASVTAFVDLSARYPAKEVVLVNHHVDPRIPDVVPPADRPRLAYFGEMVNTVATPSLEEHVEFVAVDTSTQDQSWFGRLPGFNAHFAIRSARTTDYHKPFLKGFTAAACRSNILIQESELEAVHWLGSDYPYFLRGPITEETVLAAVLDLEADFGSERWNQGLKRMAEIRARVAPARIAAELRRALA